MRITTDQFVKDENGNLATLVATSPENLLKAMECENIDKCTVTTYFGGEKAISMVMTQNDVKQWIKENSGKGIA